MQLEYAPWCVMETWVMEIWGTLSEAAWGVQREMWSWTFILLNAGAGQPSSGHLGLDPGFNRPAWGKC